MTKTAKTLLLAAVVGAVATTPATTLADSVATLESAALRALLHSAAFNHVDGLGAYNEDLSGFAAPRPAKIVPADFPGAVNGQAETRPSPSSAAQWDPVALQLMFHNGEYNVTDDLGTYNEDFAHYGQTAAGGYAQVMR